MYRLFCAVGIEFDHKTVCHPRLFDIGRYTVLQKLFGIVIHFNTVKLFKNGFDFKFYFFNYNYLSSKYGI